MDLDRDRDPAVACPVDAQRACFCAGVALWPALDPAFFLFAHFWQRWARQSEIHAGLELGGVRESVSTIGLGTWVGGQVGPAGNVRCGREMAARCDVM